jgi:hypothetical protein
VAVFSLGFPAHLLYAMLISPMRTTYPAHLTLFDFFHLSNI